MNDFIQGISIPKWALVAILALGGFATVVWRVATVYSNHMTQTAESHQMLCDLERKIDSTRVVLSCRATYKDEEIK